MPPPISGSFAALNAATSSTSRKTSPMMPIGSGLRCENDLPIFGALRVVSGLRAAAALVLVRVAHPPHLLALPTLARSLAGMASAPTPTVPLTEHR